MVSRAVGFAAAVSLSVILLAGCAAGTTDGSAGSQGSGGDAQTAPGATGDGAQTTPKRTTPDGAQTVPGAAGGASRGAALVSERCARCHTLERVESARKTFDKAKWQATVERMRRAGAQLTDAEAADVVEHLSGGM